MGDGPQVVDAAPPEKVKVKVQAEFFIDPLDHVPLAERRAMLRAGRPRASARGSPSCKVDAALKRVTPRILLEAFMGELAYALKPSSVHGYREQKITESSSQYDLKDEQSLGEQNCDVTFADRTSVDIQKNVAVVNFEPVEMSYHLAANFEDRYPCRDCRSQISEQNVCRQSHEVPCFGLKGCSYGQKDADMGYDDIVLSSADHMIKVKVVPFDNRGHRNAGIAHKGKANMISEAEQEHVDHASLHKRHKLSHSSSITGECSQVDVSLKPDHCFSSLNESRNATTMQRRTSICYSGAEYQQDVSGHTEEHDADKLNDENSNVDTPFPSVTYTAKLSGVNAVKHTYASVNVTPESFVSPSTGAKVSSMDVNNQCDASLEASDLQRSQGGSDSNSDGAYGAESMECVSGLKEQLSLIANKWHSDSILSTDLENVEYKFSVNNCLSEESAAKRMCNSISAYPESYTQRVGEVLSYACTGSLSSDTNSFLEKEVQTPTLGQKEETHLETDLLVGSSVSTSIALVKPELADEDAETHLSETDALKESSLLHSSSNTWGPLQAFISQDNNPFLIRSLQKNCEHGDIFSQGMLTNHLKTPLVSEREGSFSTKSQPCVSALSFAPARVKVEATDLSYNNQVHNQAPKTNSANCVCTSVFDTQENSVLMNPYTVSANDLSFSPGRMKVETREEIHVVSSSATTLSTRSFDSSNLFEGDPSQVTLHTVCEIPTIQEGESMRSNKMSSNVPAGSNLRDLPPSSVAPTFLIAVKVETTSEDHPCNVSETEGATKFNRSAFECSDKAVGGMNACAGMCLGEIYCNTADLPSDSALLTFPMRVTDEPLQEVHVDDVSETMTKKYSGLPIFKSSDNVYLLSPLPDAWCSSKAINCQSVMPSGICTVPHNQEKTITGSAQVNIPGANGIISGQKQSCKASEDLDSDVSALKDIENVEQLVERYANINSGNAAGILDCPYSSSTVMLKTEPEESGIQNLHNNPLGTFSSSNMLLVEDKNEIVSEFSVDTLDHIPLTERIKILSSGVISELKPARCFKQEQVHAVSCDPDNSLKVKVKSLHRRKRKKTATDSVEIALQEDAPGLLQGLLCRGINVDEIKLYGCEEDVDALDTSSNEDSFEDLEAVISKLFSERPTSLFKLAALRPVKGAKAVYCLACLISLIEQTRYLRFRRRPVEWGWCRDLQSFIFVFEMHNRIVLERPEYGYATYFFELVASFPIDWQLKRLVTAMKLTSCSRATLIENKPLLVGVDLSEGEARVLEEYGWRPDTGLGSLLNYCDRVVHDRRNERDSSEWRLKIGKLLMDGYDGGRVVKADLPKKVIDYVGSHCLEIKIET